MCVIKPVLRVLLVRLFPMPRLPPLPVSTNIQLTQPGYMLMQRKVTMNLACSKTPLWDYNTGKKHCSVFSC